MTSSPPETKAKKEKFPRNAYYGELDVDDRTYEFARTQGEFCLRFTNKEGAKLKILLRNVPNGNDSYRWLPTDIYHVRSDGNRRIYSFGRFYSHTFLDAITANRLTKALRKYEK